MCYPMTVADTGARELEDVQLLLEAANKYDVEKVLERACGWLVARRFLNSSPVMVYAIACQQNLDKEAKAAARSTVGLDVLRKPLEKELDIMTARQLHTLLQYNRCCIAAMMKVIANFNANIWDLRCPSCGTGRFPRWLECYLGGVAEAVTTGTWNGTRKSRLMAAAMEKAKKCISCRERAPVKLRECVVLLKAKMNEAISEVEFEFCP